ncbi:hypothetical protein RJ640_006506 [Escallonia rubra]|uniref:Uncharacterized protein n=1 Tax=Escallonia rubra TaxID=112253 RepID=A0AA88R6T0_9ASTE|nr:hypothetical protein RJ640_006506 [Escallonia rubra]
MIPIAIAKVGEGKTEDEEEVKDNGFEYRQCDVDVVIVEDEEEQEPSLSLKFTACVVNGSQGQHGRRGRRTHSSSSFNQSPHQFQSKNPTHTKKPSYLSSSNPMKDDQNASNSSSTIDHDEKGFPTVTGTCPFMCPEEERALRERLRDLAVFERLDSNPGKTSSALAVKKSCIGPLLEPLLNTSVHVKQQNWVIAVCGPVIIVGYRISSIAIS